MDQPSNINLYDYPSKNMSPPLPNNVSGWLLGVHGYRDSPLHTNDQQENNNTTMIANHMERRKSISSIASEDSVNLDDLIKANFTLDMDDETDLPNLASLDLGDDSKEDFWKMDKELSDYQKPKETYRKDTNFVGSLGKVRSREEEEAYNSRLC
ncbi:hypothetical protein BC941DRAFT_131984 [Chlamydoabsidia padenii]|nr:hypothetical protein BC941DRAFT_131984 [Chlamydoabsidia padenii]